MTSNRIKVRLKVVPSVSSSGIVGWLGDSLKVRVTAPPEKGKANRAVRELVAKAAGIKTEHTTIIAGESSPNKTIELCGLTEAEFKQRISSGNS